MTWKPWLLSSLAGGLVAGCLLGICSTSLLYGVLPFLPIYILPVIVLLSNLLGSLTQRYVLQRQFGIALDHCPPFSIAWIMTQTIAWIVLTLSITFVTVVTAMGFQVASTLSFLVQYAVLGIAIGLIVTGIQLLVWRRTLRPKLLWLGVGSLGWFASALLMGATLLLPFKIRQVVPGNLPEWILYGSMSLGIASAWFTQMAIAGVVFAPGLRTRP